MPNTYKGKIGSMREELEVGAQQLETSITRGRQASSALAMIYNAVALVRIRISSQPLVEETYNASASGGVKKGEPFPTSPNEIAKKTIEEIGNISLALVRLAKDLSEVYREVDLAEQALAEHKAAKRVSVQALETDALERLQASFDEIEAALQDTLLTEADDIIAACERAVASPHRPDTEPLQLEAYDPPPSTELVGSGLEATGETSDSDTSGESEKDTGRDSPATEPNTPAPSKQGKSIHQSPTTASASPKRAKVPTGTPTRTRVPAARHPAGAPGASKR